MKKCSVLLLSVFFLLSLAAVSAEAQTGRYWRGSYGDDSRWSRRRAVRPARAVRYGYVPQWHHGYPSHSYYGYSQSYRNYPRYSSYGRVYSTYPRYSRYSTYSPYYGRPYHRYRGPVRSGISIRLGW